MEEVEFNDDLMPAILKFEECLSECLGEDYIESYIPSRLLTETFKQTIYHSNENVSNKYAKEVLGFSIKGRVLVEFK